MFLLLRIGASVVAGPIDDIQGMIEYCLHEKNANRILIRCSMLKKAEKRSCGG